MLRINKPVRAITSIVSLSLLSAFLLFVVNQPNTRVDEGVTTTSYIVQAASLEQALGAVRNVDGEITHELGIINAVGALLTDRQWATLDADLDIRTYQNREARVAGKPPKDGGNTQGSVELDYGKVVGADTLIAEGIDGAGVTIAVIDTGLWWGPSAIAKNAINQERILAQYDAVNDEIVDTQTISSDDGSGHGTHMASVALHSKGDAGEPVGIAPGADLVSVRAFDAQGNGSYLSVIRAIDYVVNSRDDYGIRVLNLSFSATPMTYYWQDPLNQAVMAAWQAGIVVVASAGNAGPAPGTIGVPGNVPYVITVGSINDNYSPTDDDDDMLSRWSSAGPTFEAFIKPELVAPGSHLNGFMPADGHLPQTYEHLYDSAHYFTMSGTSQSAAVVSGVVALLLQDEPWLSPDDVKCRLMASTDVGIIGNGPNAGELRYSPLQQGAGRVDAYAAVHGDATGCGNLGLDIDQDLAGTEHYFGPVRMDETSGDFYVEGVGYYWDGSIAQHGDLWVDGNPFIDVGGIFIDGNPFSIDGNPFIDAISSFDINGSPFIDINGSPFIDINGSPFIDINGSPFIDINGNPFIDGDWVVLPTTINAWIGATVRTREGIVKEVSDVDDTKDDRSITYISADVAEDIAEFDSYEEWWADER